MVEIKSNEPEFNSQVISWLNEFIEKGAYPFDCATSQTSIKSGGKTKFPDVQIWINRNTKQAFCGWELKPPNVAVDDQKLLENAAEKARSINADYFVTWNMRDTVIWRTPKINEKVTIYHRAKTFPPIHKVAKPDDLWIDYKQELLKNRAKKILDDIATYYQVGHLHLIDVDSTFFVHKLSEAVNNLKKPFHEALVTKVGKEHKFKNGLFDWAAKQCIATYEAGESFYDTVSRQIVYRLIGKILFYFTLRRFRNDIPKLDLHGIKPAQISSKLKEYFEKARQIDYQAIFEEDFTDSVSFPANGFKVLINLVDDLERYNFSQMPQDVIGNVFEKLIPPEERHALGQYFTNENLVDLIIAFCVRGQSNEILDPTCGSGTFLIRAYDRLNSYGEKNHKKLLSQIWGIDIAHFPAELATINLYRQKIEDYANFPRVDASDFFGVKPNQIFKFPPPKPSNDPKMLIKEKIPFFDAIVGNFPYIRQELIEKRIKGYKNTLEKVLTQGWGKDYPEIFDSKGKIRLSGQADIYAYLFFHASRFLKEDGRMGIVTSNSWLDVAYGFELQKFFLSNFKIIAILESRIDPWFEDASVNTVVTILERCKDKELRSDNNVKFVKIKERLNELIPWDMNISYQRWLGIDKLVHKIEHTGSEFYKTKNGKVINTLDGLATHEDENFRIRIKKQNELYKEISGANKTVKWGKYLRAPDVYFEILNDCENKLISLNNLAEIKRGFTSGINEFFYLDKQKAAYWKIEEKFLAPIIKSPKESNSILIEKMDLKNLVFICNLTKKELRKQNYVGALNYILWGESQVTKEKKGKGGGMKYPEVPTVSNRKNWYQLLDTKLANIFWTKSYNDTFLQRYSKRQVYCDQRVYQIIEKHEIPTTLLAAVLNSSLFALMIEVAGRVNLGEGALDTTVEEAEKYILCPDLRVFTKKQRIIIEKLFNNIICRPIKHIYEEIKMKDRQAFDSEILKALGLDPKKYLKPIYQGLAQLVKERIDLARSRKKVKKAKTEKDIAKLKNQVIEELLPEGHKIFPEEFMDTKYLKDSNEISTTNDKLKLGNYFLGQQEIISETGFSYNAKNIDEAKFIIYSQKPDVYIVKVPKNKEVVIKAVDKFENYLKDLRAKLFEEIFKRVQDHKIADMLVQQVIIEVGLPES